uniref:RNA-binding protein 39 n=1 Tax=Steinernema glaseri TaxID=37863 RepID=A0A1I7Y8V6_9BILA
MAEPDVDALLDEALDKRDGAEEKEKEEAQPSKSHSKSPRRRSRSRSRDKKRRRSRSRSRDRDRRRRRSRSRSRSRSRDRYRRRSSRSPDRRRRRRSRSRSHERPRFIDHRRPPRRSPPRGGGGGRLPGPERRDVMPFTARRSPPPNAPTNMTPEERDERTIFILQIARQTRPRDLEEFFSSVGHVRDVRIITDSKTRRSKGIAYVEFWEREAVPLSLALNGQNLLGAPLVIQQTCAERNRLANGTVGGNIGLGPINDNGNLRLQISQLHPSITNSMLNGIFEPFGKIDGCEVVKDRNGASRGHGYVTYVYAEDGKRALEQLNGFELAGRNIKVAAVDEEDYQRAREQERLDDEKESLNASGRLQLMANLAKGSGLEIPESTQQVLQQQQQVEGGPPMATQCFMLTNMFDPAAESEPEWDLDIRDDVIDQCEAFGGVYHIHVDKASKDGNVFVKCPSVNVAVKAVQNLHGRYFSGKVIVANYIPVASYHDLFPEALSCNQLLHPRS